MVRDEELYSSIKKELEDHIDALYNNTQEDTKNVRNHTYINRVLLTDVYQSLVNSGKFLLLEPQLQNDISNLYSRINRRNDIINYLHKFEDRFYLKKYIIYDSDKNQWLYKIEKYASEIGFLERDIKSLLQKIHREVS